MKRQTKVTTPHSSLVHRLYLSFLKYYPWLLVTAIASLFLFPSTLLTPVSSSPDPRVESAFREVKVHYSKYPKILVFIANKDDRGKGKLIAVNTKKGKIDGAYRALSGVGGEENQRMLGPIPSQSKIKQPHYKVDVIPLTLSNPGIAGKFYKINPHMINVRGKTRGDFGIHADRNVPGTAGCIGIESEKEWVEFKALMLDYQRAGLRQIPLLVSYR